MKRILSFFRFLGLFIAWAFSGFGERLINYIISLIIISLTFTFIFYFFPSHFDIDREINKPERLLHSFYVSVNIMTSLDMGGTIPKSNVARICIVMEVILGYIMLAVLVSMIMKRISER
ncbi:MAG: ion transporter [Candidatus Hodarchaeota archaeon]